MIQWLRRYKFFRWCLRFDSSSPDEPDLFLQFPVSWWEDRKKTPCWECGEPIGRTAPNVKLCWPCAKYPRGRSLQDDMLLGAEEPEPLPGVKIREFICPGCGRFYRGPNYYRCATCTRGVADEPAWPGRTTRKTYINTKK